MRNISNFGETLKELMIVREKSPAQLAAAFSVNIDTIYSWKNNEYTPSLSKLIVVADYFKVRLDFLAGRSDLEQPCANRECPPFAKRLREVMKEKGMTTYYFRKNTRYGSSFFVKWENGADPLLPTLMDLADILDCSIDYLVGREI